jgi:putative aldouronate transport system substrate-binding protein
VAQAVSDYLRPIINADVKFTILGYSSYIQQVYLSLSSGEELDAFPLLMMSLSTLVDNGSIIPLDDLYAEFGQDMKISQDELVTQMLHGELYGIPVQTDGAFMQGLYLRKDLLDAMGIEATSIQSMDDFYPVLQRVKNEFPGVYPLVSNMGSLGLPFFVDYLGDSSNPMGVLVDSGNGSLIVENLYENQTYVDHINRIYAWAKEGLIMPEASSNTELDTALFRAGKGFSTLRRLGEPKQLQGEISLMAGQEIIVQPLTGAYSTTDDIPSAWVIPSASKNAERAMQFINLAYTDQTLANFLCHGLEGRHYVISNPETNQIDFPEGKSSTTIGYPQKYWGWPNQTISFVFQSQDAHVWDFRKEFVGTATQSPAKGFLFDNSSVSAEITACKNVLAKYHTALLTGSINPSDALPKLNDELRGSGLDSIIAEKQKQLDAWAG